ncbi:MAG TPA: beta-ketoacyl synthase N-terminal-like domain-containing protein, partial [Blastocatellia bacterium]|nr:beta-ketoacyl synthase N-terminal-like domain-containing protein [Blastocatellia bacterium]
MIGVNDNGFPQGGVVTAQEIQTWLIAKIAELTGLEPSEISVSEPFSALGLTSREAVMTSGDLEDRLGRRLPPSLLYDYPSIEALVRHLASPVESADPNHSVAPPLPSRPKMPEGAPVEPIAIIGMSCRFPGGARDPRAFWTLLRQAGDAITEVPPDRWDWRAFCDAEPMTPGKINARWGGFLPEVASFDAQAFGLSPREAARMDPQHRLLLEIAWEALEDAGLSMERLRGTPSGVFIGCSNSDYGRLQLKDPFQIDALVGTGNAGSMAASRLSYWLDLRGPSLVIDTACSSSLVAVHLACQSLRQGESTIALAGGVNVILLPEPHIMFSRAGLFAPDGRCKVFDERADGYVRSEGAGLVVLKPLSLAIADADPIYAVIRGGAVNQDGRSNGITAPSRQAQEALLRDAYRRAGISPAEVQYVEAHGTGTALGDVIEVQALGSILSPARQPGRSCFIGSVKSNIGHLESAAGIAGLIKVALSLKYKEIPPSLHFKRPNPQIPFESLALSVAQRLEPWPESSVPARAGVSAFSFGGTNAHLVLEEAPPTGDSGQSRPWQTLTLSARTESALERMTANLSGHLKQTAEGSLADTAYTLQTGRSPHRHRRIVVCQSPAEAADALDQLDPKKVFTAIADAQARPVVFMFPGLGEHYVKMAHGLYRDEPVFRAEVDHSAERLKAVLGLDLREVIFTGDQEPRTDHRKAGRDLRKMLRRRASEDEAAADQLNRTALAQPAVFVVEYALAKLLIKWGLRPEAMIGHSLGEYVAACLAGVFTLEEGLWLVAQRARLIEGLPAGRMLAVALSEEEVRPYLGRGVWLGAANGPKFSVLSGAAPALEEVERKL